MTKFLVTRLSEPATSCVRDQDVTTQPTTTIPSHQIPYPLWIAYPPPPRYPTRRNIGPVVPYPTPPTPKKGHGTRDTLSPRGQNDTRLWEHYLPATSLADDKKTRVINRILKSTPSHAFVIYQIPWIQWKLCILYPSVFICVWWVWTAKWQFGHTQVIRITIRPFTRKK